MLWKKKRELQAQLPFGLIRWAKSVPIGCKVCIDPLLPQVETPTNATPNWEEPPLARRLRPVCNNSRLAGEVPAMRQIVGERRFELQLVQIRTLRAACN